MVTPTATAPEVTQVGDQIFRVCFLDSFQGEVMANFAHSSLGARRAAVLVERDTPYSRGLAQYFKGEFLKQGGENVAEETYAGGDTDFGAQLRAIKAASPDVIFVPGYYQEAGLIAKQARAAGITVPLLGGDGWDAPQIWEIGGDAVDGSFISSHFSPETPAPEIEKFVADYAAGHAGRAPDAFAALGYDTLRVLAHALERAKSTEPGAIRGAITRTSSFPGVTGEITINRERNALKDAVVVELRDGKSIYRATMSALLM
jgi:branched-chain amino acid transport system substrate-binding protein